MADTMLPPNGVTIPQDIKLSQEIKNLVYEFKTLSSAVLSKITKIEKTGKSSEKVLKDIADNQELAMVMEDDKKPVRDDSISKAIDFQNNLEDSFLNSIWLLADPIQNLSDTNNENLQSIKSGIDDISFYSEFMAEYLSDMVDGIQKDIPVFNQPTDIPSSPNNDSVPESKPSVDEGSSKLSEFGDKISTSINDGLKGISDSANQAFQSVSPMLLGQLRLITDPIQDLTGFSVSDKLNEGFQSITDSLFDKGKKKMKPSRSDVAQAGDEGIGMLWLGDKLDKIFGTQKKGEDEEGMGFFASALGGGVGKAIGGMLTKGLGIGMIVTSLVLMLKDGIMGAMKADEWGVGKGAAIAGAVLGGTGEGWKNAFANAGKWALMGAGIGLLAGGPIGALIGGLIGAVVGGIMGFFGGKKIAKFIENTIAGLGQFWDNVKEFFKNSWDSIKNFFINMWNSDFITKIRTFIGDLFTSIFDFIKTPFINMWNVIVDFKDKMVQIWSGDESFLKKLGKTIGETLLFFPKMIWGWISGLGESMKNWFIDMFIGRKETADGKKAKKALIVQFWDILKTFWGGIGKMMMKGLKSVIDFFSQAPSFIKETIIPGIKEFFSGVFTSIVSGIGDMTNFVKSDVWPFITEFFGNIFNNIKETWNTFWEDPGAFISNIWKMVTDGIQGLIDKVMGIFKFFDIMGIAGVGELIKSTGSGEGLMGTVDKFTTAYSDLTKVINEQLGGELPAQEKIQTFAEQTDLANKNLIGRYKETSLEDLLKNIISSGNIDANTQALIDYLKVDDAIITNTGQVIRTSPDDNIFATKNPIQAVSTKSDQLTYREENQSSEIVEVLKALLQTAKDGNIILENKDMNPTVVNQSSGGSLRELNLVGAME